MFAKLAKPPERCVYIFLVTSLRTPPYLYVTTTLCVRAFVRPVWTSGVASNGARTARLGELVKENIVQSDAWGHLIDDNGFACTTSDFAPQFGPG